MNTEHTNTSAQESATILLGKAIRAARKQRGWTLAQLAERMGRPREWLNRAELGYSEFGEHRPPTLSDITVLLDLLKGNFAQSNEEVLALAHQADADFYEFKQRPRKGGHKVAGKLTQTEVIIGEAQIANALVDIINEQDADSIIRNTGIKIMDTQREISEDWRRYRNALGDFLAENPNALFKRLEYAGTEAHLAIAKETDSFVSGGRPLDKVHNLKFRFAKKNPLQLHAFIGKSEAVIALPHVNGRAGAEIALLIRDKMFVDALRSWFDEVLWEASGKNTNIDFKNFDKSFDDIANMYGFENNKNDEQQ